MRVHDETRVTNTLAAAIEFIQKPSNSSLAAVARPALVKELRGAIRIVTMAARRELLTMTTPELERLVRYGLCVLAARQEEPPCDFVSPIEATFVRLARALTQPPFEDPRISSGAEETASTHCGHCGIELDSATATSDDVAQIEPLAKAWPGRNLYVRVVLQRAEDEPDCTRWTPFDLCQPCFEYVLSAAARSIVPSGDEARRRVEENG